MPGMNGCCCFAGLPAVTLRARGAAEWRQLVSTPREQGFVMPPEWAPHERCWMAWPCREEHWGERIAAAKADMEINDWCKAVLVKAANMTLEKLGLD